jgi:hypothetical protein
MDATPLGLPRQHQNEYPVVDWVGALDLVVLFDHLVSDSEHARRDGEAKRVGCLQADAHGFQCRPGGHYLRSAISRTHCSEIPSASPIALSVAPDFRARAIALLRLTPRAISCRILAIAALSTRFRSFLRAAALARRRMYDGYVCSTPERRCNRPMTAPRVVPSSSAIFAADKPSPSKRRSFSSCSGVQKLPLFRLTFLISPQSHPSARHLYIRVSKNASSSLREWPKNNNLHIK